MKKALSTLVIALFGLSAVAQYDPEALTTLDAMSARYKKIEAFNASFTQKLINKDAGLDESLSGAISVKGEKYVLDVAGQKIFNNGTDVYTYSEEVSEVTISPNETDEAEVTLGNIYDLYKDGFKYALLSTQPNGDKIIELDPESRDKTYFKIKMVITSKDELKSFTIYERTNNVYTYLINSFEEILLADDFFTFDTSQYPGVEVIDFR